MADSFSSQLRLVQQTDQGNVNIWGKNFNEGVIDLMETALAGRQDIDVTFGSVTLTLANGGTDTSRPMFLSVTGNPGTTRDIVVPSLQKLYVVVNKTSPAFDIEVKTAANPGITVAGGESLIVYVDEAADAVKSPIDADAVTIAALPFSTTTFDIANASAGDTTVTVSYVIQGGFRYCRMPAFSTTISVGGNDIFLQPQTSVPLDLIPSTPLAHYFPMTILQAGVLVECALQVPNLNADWAIPRADGLTWTAATTRVMSFDLSWIHYQLGT